MECTGKKTLKRRFLRRLGTLFVVLGILCAAALAGTDIFIRPTLKTLLDYKCRTAAERIISNAVFERLGSEEAAGDIVSFTFDSSGRVAALNTDRVKINSLKALLNDAVNEGIEALGDETVRISLGTLTGISFLYGTGDELVFRMEPKGKAETRLMSSFRSSGINQTIHSIILEVDAEISPMMTGYSEDVAITYDILIAQTVIVGSVPDSYSNIILDEGNVSELANIDI